MKLRYAVLVSLMLIVPMELWAQSAGAGVRGVPVTYPMKTRNVTVATLYHEYQILIEEVFESVSQGNPGLLVHDSNRWKSNLTALSAYLDFSQARGIPDRPVTHGRGQDITGPLNPDCVFKSNPYVCELVAELVNARDEMVTSASTNIPRSLYPADETRQREYWASMGELIAYMETYSPMDQPVTAAEENLGITPPLTPPASP